MFREGEGLVRGAGGIVVTIQRAHDLPRYRGLQVDPITVARGLLVPGAMAGMVQAEFEVSAARLGLPHGAAPALMVCGEIIHYEEGDTLDKALGPLQQVIVHTKLYDAQTRELLGEANLIGRARASSASGPDHLAEGASKALARWLQESGVAPSEEVATR